MDVLWVSPQASSGTPPTMRSRCSPEDTLEEMFRVRHEVLTVHTMAMVAAGMLRWAKRHGWW